MGGVFAYRIPYDDLENVEFEKIVIAQGGDHFKVQTHEPNGGAPGFIEFFLPSKKMDAKKERPWILLAGDGAFNALLLTPSEKVKNVKGGDISYDIIQQFDFKGEVGTIAVGDFIGNGDGYMDFFLP